MATADDIRRYQLHQHENGVSLSTINGAVSALRILFDVTLKRRDLSRALVITRYQRQLPDVLSIEEAGRLLQAAPGIKYKAALGVAYGAGLRVSEVAHLKIDDIDSARMLIRIEQGKGRKDRNAMLSPQLLELLRLWWREGKQRGVMLPHGWLFPGRLRTDPVSSRPTFLLPVRVLGALFRRLFSTRLIELHSAGKLVFFGKLAGLSNHRAFLRHLAPIRRKRWVVYAKAPFSGPEAVLAYLSRYTHRVAISNSRLLGFDGNDVTFLGSSFKRFCV